ncbi:uncharacterized protein LOC126628021 [Malus sylvestris]|uniref:uncharacterized protein LOC126602113 n=1 Tax=Malus sylvestris TaxID=3752 RepID=UPI0021ACEEB5|nr:uncharacterized protein LOC126602113 [Malus sylvestris]XP_050153555.1 uncharacterized protein LOC126628021 [Malus sylvestris]
MSLPLGSLSSLTSLPLLCTVHTRTHPSPRARKPITLHHLVLLSLPLVSVNSAKNPERNSGGFLYFPVRLWDEIEAGCKHTQLRQPRGFFRPSPAIPRRKEGLRIEAYNPDIQTLPHRYLRVL